MRSLRMTLGLAALLAAVSAFAEPASISDVRIAHTPDRTRIVLDLSAGTAHNLFALTNPNRVVVDVSDARFAGSDSVAAAGGLVAGIRTANREDGRARLVLDLDEAVRSKSFALQPGGGYGHRVVVDLFPVTGATQSAAPASAVAAKSAPAANPPAVTRTAPSSESQRDLVIAIDAGHGGKDPGARGHGGLLEKDVVLRISKRLAELVDREPGMRAYLVRSDDTFYQLSERMARAHRAGADLFVSIHADAFTDRRVRGASVYVLSEKGASDEAAKLLAERENSSDSIGGVSISDKNDTLAGVLVDLSQNAALEASIEVGEEIINEMSRVGKVRKTSVQKAGFRVLKSPDIPSVLIETAFISNPQDESNLKSVQYQQRLAQAMHSGIRDYFYANPPAGTMVAALSRSQGAARQHVIRSGDTLSEIAQRYNVSVSHLQSTNRINGSRIRVGQVLTIPPSRGI